jgi:hypothetical protein
VFKNSRTDKHHATADCGDPDIVQPKKINAESYVFGAACNVRAELYNFVRERRSPSAFPTFGSQCSARRSQPSRIETRDNLTFTSLKHPR